MYWKGSYHIDTVTQRKEIVAQSLREMWDIGLHPRQRLPTIPFPYEWQDRKILFL